MTTENRSLVARAAVALTNLWPLGPALSPPAKHTQARVVYVTVIVLLTALPALNIIRIIATSGANNLYTDFITWVPIVDQVLSGEYAWQHFFRDSFQFGVHSFAVPILASILFASLGTWNVYPIMYFGVLSATVQTILLQDALTYHSKDSLKHLMWPLLAILVFSLSQIDYFTGPYLTMHIGLTQLGFILGLWGMVRFPGQPPGVLLMIVGGIVATLSWGNGPMVWPAYLIGMMLLGNGKLWHYITWLMAGLLSSLPYFLFIDLSSSAGFSYTNILNLRLFVNAIGWPFTQDFPVTIATGTRLSIAGVIGIALLITGLVLVALGSNASFRRRVAPAIMLHVFAILTIGTIIVARNILIGRYATPLMMLWVGMLGLAYVFVTAEGIAPTRIGQFRRLTTRIAPMWGLAFLVAVIFLYMPSNLTYRDKASFLYTRSPVSASCLRNYRGAPPYCSPYLFQLRLTNLTQVRNMAVPLERHNLSVFAPRQRWTLQGDFIFETVQVTETPGVPDVFWSASNSIETRTPWDDYQRLNLVLHAPNSISWTVHLPQNIEQATFRTAIATSRSAIGNPASDGVEAQVLIEVQDKPAETIFSQRLAPGDTRWQQITIPLAEYAGETVTLHLSSAPGENAAQGWVLYKYPRILVHTEQGGSAMIEGSDLLAIATAVPQTTDRDLVFDTSDLSQWETVRVRELPAASGGNVRVAVGEDPILDYAGALEVCHADYSHIHLRMAVSPDIPKQERAAQIFYRVEGSGPFHHSRSAELLLAYDGEMHTYTYPLKLLELDQKARLVDIRLDPVRNGGEGGEGWVEIADFRLIRREGESRCQGSDGRP